MAERNVVGNTAAHLNEMMKRTTAAMKAMQPDVPGTTKRTTQERNRVWNQLISLPTEERQAMLLAMSERAGHQYGEAQPCELCQFIASKAVEKSR